MTDTRRGILFVAAALAASLSSCATARLVVVKPAGGEVAIFRNTPEYRKKAVALMSRKCPGGYTIVREEEYVTGETVTKERTAEYDKSRKEVRTTEEKKTRNAVEWRITFTCR
ncbi:MAG: hypothetical protein ACYC9Y_06190 [Candidatus Methylomirabilia bacterium]